MFRRSKLGSHARYFRCNIQSLYLLLGETIANHNPGSIQNRLCVGAFEMSRRPAEFPPRSHAWFKINCGSAVSGTVKVEPWTTAHVNTVNANTERTQRKKPRITKSSRAATTAFVITQIYKTNDWKSNMWIANHGQQSDGRPCRW